MPSTVDFALAQSFLEQARRAFEAGDPKTYQAARYMLLIVLGLADD